MLWVDISVSEEDAASIFMVLMNCVYVDTEMMGEEMFFSQCPTCPCGLRGLPSWAWQKCNRLLRLGRP